MLQCSYNKRTNYAFRVLGILLLIVGLFFGAFKLVINGYSSDKPIKVHEPVKPPENGFYPPSRYAVPQSLPTPLVNSIHVYFT